MLLRAFESARFWRNRYKHATKSEYYCITSGIMSRMPTEGRLSLALYGLNVDAEGELTKDRRSFSIPDIYSKHAHIYASSVRNDFLPSQE